MEQTECRVTCPRMGEKDVQMTLGAMIEHMVVCGPGHMVVLVEPLRAADGVVGRAED